MLRIKEIENFVPLGNLSRGSFLSSLFPAVPTIRQLLDMFDVYLPVFLDLISQFQYQKASILVRKSDFMQEWKCWNALEAALLLLSACESTYHTMIYLESAQHDSNESMIRLYMKILVLWEYLKDECRLYIDHTVKKAESASFQWEKQNGTETTSHHTKSENNVSGKSIDDPQQHDPPSMSVETRLRDYTKLFEQLVKLCELRIGMMKVYNVLVAVSPPHNYNDIIGHIVEKGAELEWINHPLLSMIRDCTSCEIETVKTALQCERMILSYDPVGAITALHHVKVALRDWNRSILATDSNKGMEDAKTPISSDIESLSEEYHVDMKSEPLFRGAYSDGACESTGIGLHDPASKTLGRRMSLPESDPQGLQQCMILKSEIMQPLDEYLYNHTAEDIRQKLRPSQKTKPLCLRRGNSVSSMAQPRNGTRVSAFRNFFALVSRPTTSLLREMISQQEILSDSTSLRTASSDRWSGPFAALLNPNFSSLGPGYAAEFLSVIDGNIEPSTLPILRWAQRFHSSLIAKFSFYNCKWLCMLENGRPKFEQGSLNGLTGLIAAYHHPLATWYLQLMESYMALGNGNDKTCIVLILETDQLEDKDACHHYNGFWCPKKPKINKDGLQISKIAEEQTINHARGSSPVNNQDFCRAEGLGRWPPIVTYPPSKVPMKHWPNLISLIADNRQKIRESIVHRDEKQLNAEYYATQIDPTVHLAVIQEDRRQFSGTVTTNFMKILKQHLQHEPVLHIINNQAWVSSVTTESSTVRNGLHANISDERPTRSCPNAKFN